MIWVLSGWWRLLSGNGMVWCRDEMMGCRDEMRLNGIVLMGYFPCDLIMMWSGVVWNALMMMLLELLIGDLR